MLAVLFLQPAGVAERAFVPIEYAKSYQCLGRRPKNGAEIANGRFKRFIKQGHAECPAKLESRLWWGLGEICLLILFDIHGQHCNKRNRFALARR